jgi:hypothetical protein
MGHERVEGAVTIQWSGVQGVMSCLARSTCANVGHTGAVLRSSGPSSMKTVDSHVLIVTQTCFKNRMGLNMEETQESNQPAFISPNG